MRTLALAIALSTCAASPVLARAEKVASVHDGDTFRLIEKWTPYGLGFSVRLLASQGGIDTPEIGSRARCEAENAAAVRARDYAREIITASGMTVWLSRVSHDRNGGRILADATVKVGGKKRSLGDMLIEGGYAVAYNGTGARKDWCLGAAPVNILPPEFQTEEK